MKEAKYCKDNGIHLIRISYKDFDRTEKILTVELTKLGVLLSEPRQIAPPMPSSFLGTSM